MGKSLALVGPPGVGKTLIAKSLGKILNIPFAEITLGGQNDGELLHGHGYTYSSSSPGMIVKKMIEAGKSRCILYFDELDKTGSKNGQVNEIMNILIHITDPNSNNSFQDRFFQGIDIPLDNVIMIFSYNDSTLIDPILRDRLHEIEINPYSIEEKIMISKRFIIPEICKDLNLPIDTFILENTDLKEIIEKHTYEAGVRGIKKVLESILLEINLKRLIELSYKLPIKINDKLATEILDNDGVSFLKINPTKKNIGIVSGLYASKLGLGGVTIIQVTQNYISNKEFLTITGQQGNIMKESVMCAFNYVQQYIYEKNLIKEITEKYKFGFHIHAPEGAVAKDGPSAGCAFALAFYSFIMKIPISENIAMTGEIDIDGNITKIGGLLYKLQGAKRAGIENIILSTENKETFDKIILKYNELIPKKVFFISNFRELVENVLINL